MSKAPWSASHRRGQGGTEHGERSGVDVLMTAAAGECGVRGSAVKEIVAECAPASGDCANERKRGHEKRERERERERER